MLDIEEKEIMRDWNNDSTPLVTIRSLAYNHELYIENAIDGFLMQKTNFPFEILIHDDASTDNTAKIIKEYEKKYPNIIRAIYQVENQWSKHDGTIIKTMDQNIRGKYTAYCECDDYWTDENKLQKQISYMESHPDCSMTCHAVNYEENGKITRNDRSSNSERDLATSEIIEGGGLFIATNSICARTDYILDRPKFWKISDVGDYPLQIAMGLKGKVHYFPDIMSVYRYKSPGSWTENDKNRESHLKHIKTTIRWMNELNEYTEKSFKSSIQLKISDVYMQLYEVNECSFFKCLVNVLALGLKKRTQMIGRIKRIVKIAFKKVKGKI